MFIIISISPLPFYRSSANSFVVQKTAANTAGAIATSGTTSTISVTAGDGLIIVGGFASGNTQNSALSCSDNLAQSWTTAIQQNQQPNSGKAQNSIICYKANTVGGMDAGTITINTAAQGLIVIALYEVTPALSFSGILSESCKQLPQMPSDCITNTANGNFGAALNSNGGWTPNISNASLVLSVVGGTAVGTSVNITTPTPFDVIVQRNIVAGTNSSQMIAEGNGKYWCAAPIGCNSGIWLSGVAAAFGPFTVTTTDTITGWLFPNFAQTSSNGSANTSWILGMLMLLLPVGFIDGAILKASPNVERATLIFLTLIGLLVGSIIGLMMSVLPVAVPFVFGIVFTIYLWKGRG